MTPDLPRLGYSVRAVANWILDYAEELGAHHTNMGINKLTFFAFELFLLRRRVILTNAKIEAWEHGPVFREIYQSFKQFGNGNVLGRARSFSPATGDFKEPALSLSEEDESFLREALLPLMERTAAELRAISHREGGAWHRVWWYKGHANPGMEISPALLLEADEGKLA